MLILALDTTTRGGSCALVRAGAGDVVLAEFASEASRSQAERIPSDLMQLLVGAGRGDITLGDIDVFAVATGPGSFTGLRVGIAAMQALALAGGKPLVGVSVLDALAFTVVESHGGSFPPTTNHQPLPRIVTWVDAWRGEVYVAEYAGEREVAAPIVADPSAWLAGLAGERAPTVANRVVFVGDGAATYRKLIGATLGEAGRVAEVPAPLLAGAIARLAAVSVRAGHRPPPHAIRELYVRRPDVVTKRSQGVTG